MELVRKATSEATKPLHARLLSLTRLAAECSDISQGQLRNWVEAADENGLSWAICRPHGNRVLIDPDRFDLWLLAKTGGTPLAETLPFLDVELASRLVESLTEFVELAKRTGTTG